MAVSTDPALRALRKQLGNKKYRQLVSEAHKRGFTVKSYATGGPEGMMERTKTSLAQEAAAATAAAFKPAETQLNTALARHDALSSKRERDMAAFQQWTADQMGRFQQASLASQAVLLQQNHEILAEQGAAKRATEEATKAQLMQTGLGQSTLAALNIRPDSVAAQGAAAQQASAGAQRVAATIGRNIEGAAQVAGNTQATIAGIQETGRQASAKDRQVMVDSINELAGKKAAAQSEYLQGLTKQEQEKAIQRFQTEAAAEIAGQKLGYQQEKDAADRKARSIENSKDRANARFLERLKQEDRQSERDLEYGLEDDKFTAKYGKSRNEWRSMSSAQRESWLRRWHRAQGKGAGKDPLAWTPQEARSNVNDIQAAINLVRRAEGKSGKKRAADIRRLLEGMEVPPSLHRYIVNAFKSGRPGYLNPAVRAELEQLTGGHVKIPSSWFRG